jgi:hypothetical protein
MHQLIKSLDHHKFAIATMLAYANAAQGREEKDDKMYTKQAASAVGNAKAVA